MKESSKIRIEEVLIRRLNSRYKRRQQKAYEQQSVEGNRDKKPIMYKIDRMLDYSGINRKGRVISAEVFIAFMVLCTVIINAVSLILTHKLVIGMMISIILTVIAFIVLYMMTGVYFNKLESNIMTLLNLVENFNKSDDDIVQIFRKSIAYVEEPLSDLLTLFCSEAETMGDVKKAFDNLQARIEHKRFRQLLRNLQVCFRYETDFDQVIKDCRKSMIDYLAVKSERKAIILNGRMEVIILLACSVLIVFLFASMTTGMQDLLFSTFIGRIILTYCFIVLMICIVMMFMFDKNGD